MRAAAAEACSFLLCSLPLTTWVQLIGSTTYSSCRYSSFRFSWLGTKLGLVLQVLPSTCAIRCSVPLPDNKRSSQRSQN